MFALLLALSLPASVTGRGGLDAVALSVDGKTLAVGGHNRVIYLVDPESLEVRKRLWVGSRIGSLAFLRDGSGVVFVDDTDTLRVLDLATEKITRKIERCCGMQLNSTRTRALVRDLSLTAKNRLLILALNAPLDELAQLESPYAPAAWSFAAGDKLVQRLSVGYDAGERRVPIREVPRELLGLAKAEFRQKYDGWTSSLELVEFSGRVVERRQLWYTSDSDSTTLSRTANTVRIWNRSNLCATVTRDDTKLFSTLLPINHAIGVAPGGRTTVFGGLERGVYQQEDKVTPFELEPLPGLTESFTAFLVLDEGRAWGVTSAHRLIRLNKEGTVEKVVPIF
jgi:hypothetical protein